MADQSGRLPSALNDNQRRHFEVLLSNLEDSLVRVEELATSAPPRRLLTTVENDVPPQFAERAAPVIARLHERLAMLARTLGLSPRSTSRRRTISALLSAEMIRVDDSSPAQLRGYGAVDPAFHEQVAPELREIRDGLAQIASMLR